MAELGASPDERGQLLLVFAIGLAVAFVALALILNTAVVTELQASQENTGLAAERSAIAYTFSVQDGIRGLIESSNAQQESSTPDLFENVTAGVQAWNAWSQRHHAGDGVLTNVTLVNATVETRILQDDDTRDFTNRSAQANWTVVDDPRAIRKFHMNVSQDRLAPENVTCEDCFNITIEGNGTAWTLHVFNSTGGEITVADLDTGERCSVSNAPVSINLTAGTLDGDPCAALDFTANISGPRRVTYANADRVQGTYELVVAGEVPLDPHFSDTGSPTLDVAIETATVSISYRSTTLIYETERLVRPDGVR